MSERFAGRVVAITGAAQSIGLECARAFCREGARVVITDIQREQVENAAAGLRQDGFDALALTLDVRDAEQGEAVANQIVQQRGRLDVWVNNAGIAHHHDSFELPQELWQRSLDVMLSGPFYGCQAAGRVMRAQGGGAIVNMASVNGFVPQPRRAAYCSAKAGIIMLTRVLASEWATHQIRVNAVAPSPVGTSGMAQAVDAHGITSLSQYAQRHPMKRTAGMHEVVEAVLFLASDEASFITGETLCVDGGWVAYGYL